MAEDPTPPTPPQSQPLDPPIVPPRKRPWVAPFLTQETTGLNTDAPKAFHPFTESRLLYNGPPS
jgi:hypothetical protein